MKKILAFLATMMLCITMAACDGGSSGSDSGQETPGNGTDPGNGETPVVKKWVEKQTVFGDDADNRHQFGVNTAVSGDYAIVGTENHRAAYIFKKNSNGEWEQNTKLTGDASFGRNVDIDGDYAIIGEFLAKADGSTVMSGIAHIYERNAEGEWLSVATLRASGTAAMRDNFGIDVAISGNYAVVGAKGKDGYTGAAFFFKKNSDGTWGVEDSNDNTYRNENQKVTASDAAAYDYFGISVAIDGELAVVSHKDNNGSAYLFELNNATGTWSEVKKFDATGEASADAFGIDVAICGTTVVVGADQPSGVGNGYVCIFEKNSDGTWKETKIFDENSTTGAQFGYSVAIDEDFIVVGAHNFSVDGVGSVGASYIFQRGSDGTWSQNKFLEFTYNVVRQSEAGWGVGIGDGTIFVGARKGVNKTTNNASGVATIYSYE